MKRFISLALLLMLVAGAVFAQEDGSQLSGYTSGLFRTEYDAAVNPVTAVDGPVFGELQGVYLFTGLENISTYYLGQSVSGLTLNFGYYNGEDVPVSIFGGFYALVNQSTLSNGFDSGTTTTTAVGGDSYDWYDYTSEMDYTLTTYDYRLSPFYMTVIGDLNVAFSGNIYIENNSLGYASNTFAGLNVTEVESYYYNSAGAGVEPVTELDYTYTTEDSDPRMHFSTDFAAAMFRETGDRQGLLLAPFLNFDYYNNSTSTTESFTAPQQATAGNFNNVVVEDSNKEIYTRWEIGTKAAWYMPGMEGNDRNYDVIYGEIGLKTDLGGDVDATYIQYDYAYTGSGATPTVSNVDQYTTTSVETSSILDFDLSAGYRKAIYFPIAGNTTLAFLPDAELSLMLNNGGDGSDWHYISSQSVVDRTDGDGDYAFDSAADTIVSTTTEYANNANGTGFQGDITVSMTTALSFQPNQGAVEFFVAATPGLTFTVESTIDKSDDATVTTVTADGTGAVASTVVDNPTGTVTTRSTTYDVNLSYVIRGGFIFAIAEGSSVVVGLQGTTSGTVFDVQAVIKLP